MARELIAKCDTNIRCPFYQRLSVGTKGNGISIVCEDLHDNLGFDVEHLTKFKNRQELLDYVEIFCSDMHESCPYYQAVLKIKYDKSYDIKKSNKEKRNTNKISCQGSCSMSGSLFLNKSVKR